MKHVVADASVVVKWLFPGNPHEAHADRALRLLRDYELGEVILLEPPHWLAETAAVVTRLSSARAADYISALWAMDVPTPQSIEIYLTACELAQRLDHPLFDTLYHAVALHAKDGVLVTADDRYFRKAKAVGRIMRLADWRG